MIVLIDLNERPIEVTGKNPKNMLRRKMMKKLGILIVLALVLAVPAGSAFAQPPSYDSCFQVQNLSGTAASINVYYYEQGNTTPVASPADTVPANGSTTYCPLSAVSDGFNGSVVIESDQPVAAITNVTGGAWGAYNASYAGFDAGATTVNIPLLFKDNYGYNTWFNVQNVGGSAATVDIAYTDGTNDNGNTIQPNLSVTFDQATETHSQAVFAAVVSSDQPVVVTVMEVGPSSSPMLFGYNGFTNEHANPVMPLVQANNYGYTTGIQVMNTGGSARNVTLTYTPSAAGTACTQTQNVPAGQSATFALTAWAAGDGDGDNTCVDGQTFVGSAKVTDAGTQTLVSIVNQHDFGGNMGASYGAFSPTQASDTVVMPLIMQDNYGYFTGFNVMNVGSSSTTVSCTFSGSSHTEGATLAAGEALTAVQYGTALGSGYVGSATCTATGGDASIIGVVNETLLGTGQDTFLVYEAFNN
jgi:hypothetical protein